jgi:phosphatidylinositol alpha-1,6-mannosyltransferase
MSHLLVTNDFPPTHGGIQSYLHELWRRLPPDETTVLTTAHPDAAAWDREQPFRIERVSSTFLAPIPSTISRIDALAEEVDAALVLLDPAWPLGAIGPRLARPYGVVLHGAEVTIPAHLPFVQLVLRATMRGAELVVAAGGYPARQGRFSAGRTVPTVVVPPGVDTERFTPLTAEQRVAARASFGIDPDALVVLGVSRLVPRKGFDVLLQAAARAAEDATNLCVVIAGDGRDRARLEQLAQALGTPTQFIGAVDDERLPALYGCADIFAMVCRDRWFGLEQEGFGIVFLEAAACGLPTIAGFSGGSAEAVLDGETGYVIGREHLPASVDEVEDALLDLVDDAALRTRFGTAGRARAQAEFSYERGAEALRDAMHRTIREVKNRAIDEDHRLVPDPDAGHPPHVATGPVLDPGAEAGAP